MSRSTYRFLFLSALSLVLHSGQAQEITRLSTATASEGLAVSQPLGLAATSEVVDVRIIRISEWILVKDGQIWRLKSGHDQFKKVSLGICVGAPSLLPSDHGDTVMFPSSDQLVIGRTFFCVEVGVSTGTSEKLYVKWYERGAGPSGADRGGRGHGGRGQAVNNN